MKKFIPLLIGLTGFLLFPNSFANAQGVGVNSSGNPADPSAIFDASSHAKGVLIPRMTTTERDAISSPAEGLQIFNTTTKCFEAYVYGVWQSSWCATCPSPSAPTAATHASSPTQIVWNWNTVSGATGYKWSTINLYSSATDMLSSTSKTETGLACNTAYTRYVWAYSTCGVSSSTTLTQSSSVCWTCGNTLT